MFGRNSIQRLTAALLALLFCPQIEAQPNNASLQLDITNNYQNMLVRLNNTRSPPKDKATPVREGRVEISFDYGATWGTVCSTQWSLREANVVCRQLGLGYAAMANQTTQYGDSKRHPWAMVGTLCRGIETRLADCFRESAYPELCNSAYKNVAVLRCVPRSPDLSLGLREIETSAYLQAVPLTNLTCAMEEFCLSNDAYEIRKTNPDAVRQLLRFTTRADNVGNADFSPYWNFDRWQWHQCHKHFHSMEVFATFDVYNLKYEKVAQGHKASFCLMDTTCTPGITPRYTCSSTTQGISIGCSDLYTNTLDCQWVDVTNLPVNRFYILRVAINPQYLIGEISFENNGAECVLYYTGKIATTFITKCIRAPLWFRI